MNPSPLAQAKQIIESRKQAEIATLAAEIESNAAAEKARIEAIAAAKVELEIATAEIAAAETHVAEAASQFCAAILQAESAVRTYWERLRDLAPATHEARKRVNHARRILGMQPIDGPRNPHEQLRSTFDLAGKTTVAKHRQLILGWLASMPSTLTQHGRMPS